MQLEYITVFIYTTIFYLSELVSVQFTAIRDLIEFVLKSKDNRQMKLGKIIFINLLCKGRKVEQNFYLPWVKKKNKKKSQFRHWSNEEIFTKENKIGITYHSTLSTFIMNGLFCHIKQTFHNGITAKFIGYRFCAGQYTGSRVNGRRSFFIMLSLFCYIKPTFHDRFTTGYCIGYRFTAGQHMYKRGRNTLSRIKIRNQTVATLNK